MRKKEKKDLVLIHGWGFDNRVWKSFIPYLEDQWRVKCIDLPGYGTREKSTSTSTDIDQIISNIETDIPEKAILFAWSLGGMIAMKLAQRRSDIKALVLVACSPCFLNKQDWQHGVEPAEFNQLPSQLSKDKIKTLQTFAGLVAIGDKHPRETMNKLGEHIGDNMPGTETLQVGLEILGKEDLRSVMANIRSPIGMIFGENDVLVKYSTAKAVKTSWPEIQLIEIAATGHAPFLSHPQETADALTKLTGSIF